MFAASYEQVRQAVDRAATAMEATNVSAMGAVGPPCLFPTTSIGASGAAGRLSSSASGTIPRLQRWVVVPLVLRTRRCAEVVPLVLRPRRFLAMAAVR